MDNLKDKTTFELIGEVGIFITSVIESLHKISPRAVQAGVRAKDKINELKRREMQNEQN